MVDMNQLDVSRVEVFDMRLVQSERAASLMHEVVADTGEESKVYLSAMVSPAQKSLIETLAKMNRAKQADVLRAIIDEWCELKLLTERRENGRS